MKITSQCGKAPFPLNKQVVKPKQSKLSAEKENQLSVDVQAEGYSAESNSLFYSFKESTLEPESSSCHLAKLLRQDDSFVNHRRRDFLNHSDGRKLACAMILEDSSIQEEIAKRMWHNAVQANEFRKANPGLHCKSVGIPSDYHSINVKAMLQSKDQEVVTQVLINYEGVLNKKARTIGLTDNERLLSARLERIEKNSQGTFDERMDTILQDIKQGFSNVGMEFNEDTQYEFHLNTEQFSFSVTGGTEVESGIIERAINTINPGKNNILTTLSAIFGHRRDDMTFNPWVLDSLQYKEELLSHYGTADVPESYVNKMKALFASYDWFRLDELMKDRYGFGVDDVASQNGRVVGKNANASTMIEEDYETFMQNIGHAYLNIQKRYKGTPQFNETIFTLNGGKFHIAY